MDIFFCPICKEQAQMLHDDKDRYLISCAVEDCYRPTTGWGSKELVEFKWKKFWEKRNKIHDKIVDIWTKHIGSTVTEDMICEVQADLTEMLIDESFLTDGMMVDPHLLENHFERIKTSIREMSEDTMRSIRNVVRNEELDLD